MESEVRERIEQAAEEYALVNALKHDAEADPRAILGPLMGDHPEFRAYGDRITAVITPVVERVNTLTPTERRERLEELAPEQVSALAEADQSHEPPLPPLPGADAVETVRLRCAPNPNGPWHLGSARMGAVIGTYAAMYDGWMLCRFDDTDPGTKRPDPDAYDVILEDLAYLGFEPDEVVRASDRLQAYYEHARELVDRGGAYACTCAQSTFSANKREGEPCPHRDQDPAETAGHLDEMIAGEYGEGEIVLRVRTDMTAANPAERDWVALRMVDRPHPLPSAAEYRCWPMLDFQSAIDDHLEDITHIIRGKDLQDSAARQGYLYGYFGWTYPEVTHWGRIRVDEYDIALSTSEIRAQTDAGTIEGWSDPRAPTLRSLGRRGIRGDAVTLAMLDLGISSSDVELAMSSVYAYNRERIDGEANRYFLVRDGRTFPIRGDHPDVAEPPRHPDHAKRGRRAIPVGEAVLLEAPDVPQEGERVWLKGLGCVRRTAEELTYLEAGIDVVREEGVPVVHWAPREHGCDVTVRHVGGRFDGIAEPEFEEVDVDTIVQFERVGFARVDERRDDGIVAMFAHD